MKAEGPVNFEFSSIFSANIEKEIERSIETYDKRGLSIIEKKLQNSILHRPILFLCSIYSVCNIAITQLLGKDCKKSSPIEWYDMYL